MKNIFHPDTTDKSFSTTLQYKYSEVKQPSNKISSIKVVFRDSLHLSLPDLFFHLFGEYEQNLIWKVQNICAV